MGVVHLALDPAGREVALKLLRTHVAADPKARLRLAREFSTLSWVRHPRVAEVIDADIEADPPYLVTRFVPGRTLDSRIDAEGPLPQEEVVELGIELADALMTIHAAGVVHRDVKPPNVMLVPDGPVLIDFGIAHIVDEVRITMTGLVMGTPGYLSPELCNGEDVAPAADWWGLGATLTYAVTGRPPFGKGPVEVVMDRVRRGQVDLDGVEEPLLSAIRAALTVDPTDRPSGDELAGLLLNGSANAPARLAEALTTRVPPPEVGRGAPAAEATTRVPPPDLTVRVPPPEATTRAPAPDVTVRVPPPEATTRAPAPEVTTRVPPPPAPVANRPSAPQPGYQQPYPAARQAAPPAAYPAQPGQQVVYPGGASAHPAPAGYPGQAYPGHAYQAPGYQPPGYQPPGYQGHSYPGSGYPASGYPDPGYPAAGYPGYPASPGAASSGRPAPPHHQATGPAGPGGRRDLHHWVVAALLVIGSLTVAIAPVWAMVLAAVCLTALRVVDRSSMALMMRRRQYGARPNDATVVALALPWRVVTSGLATVSALVLPILLGIFTVLSLAVIRSQGELVEGQEIDWSALDPTRPGFLVCGGLVALIVAWWGPGGSSVRRGARTAVGSLTGSTWSAWVLVGFLALVLLADLLVLGQGIQDWTPLDGPPFPS